MAEITVDRQKVKFKIVYQILITMFIVSLVPLGGLWYISIYKSKQGWTDNIFDNLVQNTESLSRSVDDWTSMNLRLLTQNAASPDILGMEAATQAPVLKTIISTYEWIYLAFTILPNGQNLGRSDDNPPTFYGDREYFQQVWGGNPIGQQVLMGKTSNKPAFILAQMIKGEKDRNLGVIAIAMTLEDLSKTITKIKIGRTGYAILLDDKNRLIAHGKGAISSKLQDFTHPVLGRPGKIDQSSFVFTDEGKKIVAFSQKTKLGWTLIVQQDYEEAYAAADEAQRNALLLLAVTLVTAMLIAFLLAKRLSTPIQNLTQIADEISRGNLEATIKEAGRNDEIGALARAIERMGVSLKMAFERIKRR
ncbi:MAG: cache and HAMP domain-containing protein [Desulforhopalus sp.]|nr:cache and HAMP domain-containing protein [Desulforhopalus sp.]